MTKRIDYATVRLKVSRLSEAFTPTFKNPAFQKN